MLLRGDEGLAPLDQEAQNPKSTRLLHQGTEVVDVGGLWQGQAPAGGLLMPALEGALSDCPVVVAGVGWLP